jgi:hypothetical protein
VKSIADLARDRKESKDEMEHNRDGDQEAGPALSYAARRNRVTSDERQRLTLGYINGARCKCDIITLP